MQWLRNRTNDVAGCRGRIFIRSSFVIVLTITLAAFAGGCSQGKYKDGTYVGEGNGNNGPIKVSVVVGGGKIKDVKVTEHKETPMISDAAIEKIPKSILQKQTWDVDGVSGATMTSSGIKQAVKTALDKALNK